MITKSKGQSAEILSSKIREICKLIPALVPEIMWDTRGKIAQTSQAKDKVIYSFKNGSVIENIPMTETTRGRRFQGLLVEECAKIDQDKLTEIIMPTLVISRQVNSQVDPEEVLNQSAVFVTSAGYKDTYSYDKLIQTLCEMVGDPKNAFILGGDWKIPVVEGLQPANFIQSQEMDNSMDEAVAGYANKIEVIMNADYSVTIIDNGRGIPVDPHPKYPDKSALEVIMTVLHSGGKFSGNAYKVSGGLHGVGLSVVNALSEKLVVEIARDKKLYRQEYSRGKPVTALEMVGNAPNRRGTSITFKPDPEIFGVASNLLPNRILSYGPFQSLFV